MLNLIYTLEVSMIQSIHPLSKYSMKSVDILSPSYPYRRNMAMKKRRRKKIHMIVVGLESRVKFGNWQGK